MDDTALAPGWLADDDGLIDLVRTEAYDCGDELRFDVPDADPLLGLAISASCVWVSASCVWVSDN